MCSSDLTVNVPVLVLIVRPLMLVAVAAPRTGAVSVRPAIVAAVAPSATLVEPIVTLLFVKLPLAMFDSVLLDPLMVLFVRVVVDVGVTATPCNWNCVPS
mgnify:FL=1